MIQPIVTRATLLSMRSSNHQPSTTPAIAGGIIGRIRRQLPPWRLMR